MFDIGFGELFLIAVVALLVLGPERLPRAARFAGLWVRKARAQWYAVKSEFENDLAADELKRSLAETRESLRQAEAQLRDGAETVRNRMQKEFDEVSAAATGALEPGVEPGATSEEPGAEADADAQASTQHAHAGRDANERDENERSMESASHMDWEPPPPSDEDAGEDVVDPEAEHQPEHEHPTPPKHADDAHAGR
ncbi:Sec-independent protein translocase protein TatB [Lysobacter sp. A6]|uniref:Sec-independent protein translocase protein TatB n=1 Tax=Noviluteimonas lactosilytica TaxID=2888523 RepID=A0ABS8JHK7_9GAMM|nr:Sec-independent protein translocase protein TatB [Lysobacter lactosilyticus]MCC8363039.1 Sec-independent protein translocase protein TatB [Lysobacter lactosilyticus]